MKNDASRNTFDLRKHYSSVRMQQGRVQIDADWNEQSDIITHRILAEAGDVIGLCGGPIHSAAFHIVASLSSLTTEEQHYPGNESAPAGFAVPDFLISAGRYYVDGILCENEKLTSFLHQPDLPAAAIITAPGLYLVYIDVWQRHLTALDDPSIREIALGGPDTATRVKTVWQVKWWSPGETAGNCLTDFAAFDALIAPGTGTLSARTKQEQPTTDPCLVPPGAGYRGLENQFYRIEIHDPGNALNVTSSSGTSVTLVADTDNQLKFSGATWQVNDAVEVFTTETGSDPMNGVLGYVTAVDTGAKTVTLNINVASLPFSSLRLRHVDATYTWSRNNGVTVTTIENMNGAEITVHDLGPDAVLGFKEGQWVEIIDDRLELNGLPGQLAQISEIDRAINLITLNFIPDKLDATQAAGVNKNLHPKLRAWDGAGAIKFHPNSSEDHFIDVENGVQVRFFAGSFKTDDYWTFPARTATADAQSGNIEWPLDSTGKALAQLPFGIKHHYCRLAMLHWNGTQFNSVADCRDLFPPLTELTNLFYVSGDGQEAMPNDPLPQLLQVAVYNGSWPVLGALVRFTAQGAGRLATTIGGLSASSTNTLVVSTGADGIASCAWRLEADVTKHSQQVEARLLDVNLNPLPQAIRFNGNLSIAAQVFYDPGNCKTLAGRDTVQEAIEQLSDLISIYVVSGNDQEVMPGSQLEPLTVMAANACGPVAGQSVHFTIKAGQGQVTPQAVTDANGIATATWTLDSSTPRQEVEAALDDATGTSTTPPRSVRFTANLSVASQVAYDPSGCKDLAGATTVQQAIDELCKRAPESEPGVHILQIIAEADKKPLRNDTLVSVSRLEKGISIDCDQPLDPISVGGPPDPASIFPEAVEAKPTCMLALDLPYPIGRDNDFWQTAIFGFQSVILAGTIIVQEKTILWSPTTTADNWLQKVLFQKLIGGQLADRVLARLTLKGNYIWSSKDEKTPVYLDGDVFGVNRSNRIDLRLPSGDTRRGGDFEMWFWLTPPSETTSGIVLTVGVSGTTVNGTVQDASGASIPAVPVTLTNVATGAVRQAVTDGVGRYQFANVPPGTYQVTAASGGQSAEKKVTVLG